MLRHAQGTTPGFWTGELWSKNNLLKINTKNIYIYIYIYILDFLWQKKIIRSVEREQNNNFDFFKIISDYELL